MKPVIYARVSTRKQEDARTIETQLDFIESNAVVKARFGEPQSHYLDDGVSGYKKPLWDRPQGKKLLADAREGLFEVVLVYRFDRLGRKMDDTLQVIEELTSLGITVYDVKWGQSIDNKTSQGRLVLHMLATLAEFERDSLAERSWDGLNRKYKSGELLPNYAPLGYDWSRVVPEGEENAGHKVKGATLTINESEAEVVRLIFSLYPTYSTRGLANYLNKETCYRMPCKSAGNRARFNRESRLFEYRDIVQIINDPIYKGVVEWGSTVEGSERFPIRYIHDKSGLQIVSPDEWDRTQKLYQQRRLQFPRAASSPHLYSGLIKCSVCGGGTVYDKEIYICRAYKQHGKVRGCVGSHVKESTVSGAVISFLVDLLENKLGLKDYLRQQAELMSEEDDIRLARLRGQIEKAQTRLTNAQQLALNGLMTPEEARPVILEERETISRSEKQIGEIKEGSRIRDDFAQVIATISNDLAGCLEGLEPVVFQSMVREIFEWFTVQTQHRGSFVQGSIAGYEFRPELKSALVANYDFNTTSVSRTQS